MDYKRTAIDYGKAVRVIFKEYMHREVIVKQMKLDGIVEIDESLFGRQLKYHRGDPTVGLRVSKYGDIILLQS